MRWRPAPDKPHAMQRTLYLPVLVLAISAHAQQAYPDHVIQNVATYTL